MNATLPSESNCAGRVRAAAEIRAQNNVYNFTKGTNNGAVAGVTGNYTGTTDQILQWAACKWGIDEDIVRAQIALESYWTQNAMGDYSNDINSCHPDFRSALPCPESIGMTQVRYVYHGAAFTDRNAIKSTAYNVDYLYSIMRDCFNGNLTWLNTVERGSQYVAGDIYGCVGVWFSGRWHTAEAEGYITRVKDYLNSRIWTTQGFIDFSSGPPTTPTTVPG